MNTRDAEQKAGVDSERSGSPDECGPACGCNGPAGKGSGMKFAVCLVVALAAAAVIARGFMKNATRQQEESEDTFAAALPADAGDGAAATAAGGDVWGKPLESLADLDKVARDSDAVLVYLPAESGEGAEEARKLMQAAAEKIRIRTRGTRVSLYMLGKDTKHHAQITEKTPAPCVVAIVKGGGSAVAADGITEKKLLQAYINASRTPSSCCPPSATCD